MRKVQRYGWRPDLPDHRDLKLAPPNLSLFELPASVDLSPGLPPAYDQESLGSCTANAIAGAIQFEMMKDKDLPDFMPSRLFIYYNERVIEGDVDQDAGAMIRDGIKTVYQDGVCGEGWGDGQWPYDIGLFADKPNEECYMNARTFNAFTSKNILYQRVIQDLHHLKACLAGGFPYVFGMSVYESFESEEVAKTGILPMPTAVEKLVGGHAILCVGYDDARQAFLVRNSWGSGWGINGYFWMPYAYMANANLCDDFWSIKLV